jgi:hypothetical protein
MQTLIVKNFEALKPFADDWNRLCYEAPQHLPMLSYAWAVTYFEHFLDPGESWFCSIVLDENKLIGVLPVIITPIKRFGHNSMLFRSPTNLHSTCIDFLIKPGMESTVLPLIIKSLESITPKQLGLELRRISSQSPATDLLEKYVSDSFIIKEFSGRGSIIDTTGKFEDYRKSLSHNFSRNLTRFNTKLFDLPNVRVVYLAGAEADEKHIPTLLQVEAAGWKGKEGTAILCSKTLIAFYTALIKRLSELGWLEWHLLYTDDRPIAVHFAIKIGRSLILNKIGYDEEFSQFSPGNILLERTFKRAFESDDTDEINCLTNMPWHTNWAMTKRDYYDFWIYPKKPIPLFYGLMPAKMKQWGRHFPAAKKLYKRMRSWKRKNDSK